MKIEEGMYVRTKKGEISKIKWITFQRWEGINTVEATFNLENGDILMYPNDKFKASYNIIDLIEEGDYVNGLPVVHNAKNNGGNIVIVVNGDAYNEEEIKSILTKEVFKANEYRMETD